MSLKELRKEYSKELYQKFGFYKMDIETTREFCELYGYEFPEELNFKWAQDYDWGNDYRTDGRLTFFTDEYPGYSTNSRSFGNITHYALHMIPMHYNIDPVVIKYPYTEDELIEIEKEKKEEEESRKRKKSKICDFSKKLKINKIPETTKIKFGKYKGDLITEVINKDEKYINWCISNITGFDDYIKKIKGESLYN